MKGAESGRRRHHHHREGEQKKQRKRERSWLRACALRLHLTPPTSWYVVDVCRFLFFVLMTTVVQTSVSWRRVSSALLLHKMNDKKQMYQWKEVWGRSNDVLSLNKMTFRILNQYHSSYFLSIHSHYHAVIIVIKTSNETPIIYCLIFLRKNSITT